MFNKKKVKKFIGFILLIIFIIVLIIQAQNILGRYRSAAQSKNDVKLAFYILKDGYQEGNIFLENLYPRENAYEYTFTVSNSDGTNTADTDIKYNVVLEATTNLPLEYEVYKENSKLEIDNKLIIEEPKGNYIKRIKITDGKFKHNEKKDDTYKIKVKFPEKYKDTPEYADMIDNIKISVESSQILEGEN